MNILRCSSYLFCLALVAGLLGAGPLFAADAAKGGASCRQCHKNLAQLLPQKHPALSGTSLGACLKCHLSKAAGKPEKNAFFTGLHVAHAKAAPKVPCTACHVYKPGKVFGLAGTKTSWGKPAQADMALIEEKTVSWAGSAHLDAIHAKSNVGCGACHGKGLPEKGAEVANERCLACHGSYEELAAKTTSAKPPVRNPHKSHLGEIGCTVCHRAHDVSEAYCNGCHAKINMKIPGGK